LPGISGFGAPRISPHVGLPGISGFPDPTDSRRHRRHHGGHGGHDDHDFDNFDVAWWGYGDGDGYVDTIPYADEFGFFGSAVVLAAYIVLFAAGVEIASATREPFGRLIALGVVSLLAGQTFLNLMVATRLMPVTGITLPFVSYGGSSLLASFMAVGLLLNIGQNRPIVMARESFEFD
jgi:hypothetical protein